jgi:nitrate reductase NapE component
MNQEEVTDAEKNEYGRFAFLIISILFILSTGQIHGIA